MPLPTHLSRLCKALSWASLLGIVGLIGFFIFIAFDPQPIVESIPATGELTPTKHLMLIGLLGVNLLPGLYALINLRRLFSAYGVGDVFETRTAGYIRNVGFALIVGTLLGVLIGSVNTLVMTYDNAPGSRSISLSLSSDNYEFLLLGCLLVVIGWVMKEATLQAKELGAFV